MPGRRPPPVIDQSLCRRCQAVEPAITVRTEPLCKACFSKYVESKVVKRMESFRVRHSDPGHERKLLLPVESNASSVALLHILSQHLQGQTEKTGRTGFKICILHVDEGPFTDGKPQPLLGELQLRYPEHSFHDVSLSRVLSEDVPDLLPGAQSLSGTMDQRLDQLLSASKSATSRQDLKQTLRRKLIVQSAKDMACEAVLWPDSTTKLAERTLAETAKGRGLSLPWIVTDGESLHGMPFFYPLRELLGKEIEEYVSFLHPAFNQSLIEQKDTPIVSTKNTTIDDLMKQYFASVELEYPSIVANVVRTTRKLQASSLADVEQQCELCDLPLEGRTPEMSRLCFACVRLLPSAET